MPAIVNIPDFLKVGIMAFVAIAITNRFLRSAGAAQYTTGGE